MLVLNWRLAILDLPGHPDRQRDQHRFHQAHATALVAGAAAGRRRDVGVAGEHRRHAHGEGVWPGGAAVRAFPGGELGGARTEPAREPDRRLQPALPALHPEPDRPRHPLVRRAPGSRRRADDRHAGRLQRVPGATGRADAHVRLPAEPGDARRRRRASGCSRSSTDHRRSAMRRTQGRSTRCAATSATSMSRSATRSWNGRSSRRSRSTRVRARRSRCSARPAAARRRSSTCCRASTTPPAGGSRSTATISATVTLESLRRNVGVVLQDVFLFNATIRENIAYGKPERDAGGDRGGGAGRADPRLHRVAARRLRHLGRRAGR